MIRDRALRPGSGLAICLAMALVTSGVASSAAAQEEEAALDQEFETWLGAQKPEEPADWRWVIMRFLPLNMKRG